MIAGLAPATTMIGGVPVGVVELTDFETSDDGFWTDASREVDAEELTDFGW